MQLAVHLFKIGRFEVDVSLKWMPEKSKLKLALKLQKRRGKKGLTLHPIKLEMWHADE